ncbi:hypothetical protein [Inquilinus sp.]|uniref:hypothetical protein n=1 Tax=Inquilinus sp. TaxID=1932117 RepID=UPI0031D010CC
MNDKGQPDFSFSEQTILDEIERNLHAHGWATHVTVVRLLQGWQSLSLSLDLYTGTIDDYTNDLTGRDALAIVLAECPEPLHSKLKNLVDNFDGEFAARTQDDTECLLIRYFRIEETAGWWWKRRPAAGPLAEYLTFTGTRAEYLALRRQKIAPGSGYSKPS